MKKIHHDLA